MAQFYGIAQALAAAHSEAMGEMLIDAQFMKCPMPVLRAAKALRGMAAGEKLRVLATDPAAVGDFRDFCRESGHALVATSEIKGVFSFTIRAKPREAVP
jgi:tRNA 2-thiouridine synthesizing protein A